MSASSIISVKDLNVTENTGNKKPSNIIKDEKTSTPSKNPHNFHKINNANKNNIIRDAAGNEIKIVERSEIKLKNSPHSILQVVLKKGGINRYYYDKDGNIFLQISNNDHGHKKESIFSKHGEHAHDYRINENGNVERQQARELMDAERKQNSDILTI